MYKKWSTLKKLIWLKYTGAAGGAIWKTVTGAIVTFVTQIAAPLRNLTATLSPIQDLHGYDAPWPAGGGVNKLKNNGTSGSSNGITWTINADGSITFGGTAGSNAVNIFINPLSDPQTLASGSVDLVCSANASYNPNIQGVNFQNDIYVDGTYVSTIQKGGETKSYSGTTITVGVSRLRIDAGTVVPSNTTFYPLIAVGTTTTAWTPYENICPISGHTGVTVYLDDEVYPFDQGGLNDSSGTESNTANRIRTGYIPIPANDTITIGLATGQESDDIIRRIYYYSGKSTDTFILSDTLDGSTRIPPYTYTMTKPTDAVYFRIVLQKNPTTNPISPTGKVLYISPTTYPITFPSEAGTVYGGTLQVNEDGTGTLSVDWEGQVITLSSSNVARVNTNTTGKYRFQITVSISDAQLPATTSVNCGAIFDRGVEIPADKTFARTAEGIAVRNATTVLYYSEYTSEMSRDDFLSYIGQSLQIVYPLATPLVYNLTAEQVGQITTLQGTNVIWVDDSDEISVTYRES